MTQASLTPESGSRAKGGLSSGSAARTKASLTAGVSTRALAALVSEGGDRTKASLLGEASKRSPNTAWGKIGGARITLDTMSFSAELQDLGFTVTEPAAHTMTAETMTVLATLQDLTFRRGYKMTAETMTFAATLQDLGLAQTKHVMTAETMMVTATLQDLTLTGPTADLALGDETFSNHNANVASWTSGNHTVAAADNLVIVSLSHERPDDATAVALDPSGENIPLSLICIVDGITGDQSVTEFWGAFTSEGLGLDAAAVAQASYGAGTASGSMAVWTFSGAGRLPTTGDFATDGDNSTASLSVNLDVAAGDIMLAGANINSLNTTTPTNITKQHENTNAAGFQLNAFYRGTSSDPSISFSNSRASFAAVKIVPA